MPMSPWSVFIIVSVSILGGNNSCIGSNIYGESTLQSDGVVIDM